MSDTDVCYCGHLEDEHARNPKTGQPAECEVTGCECVHFDKADEEIDE